jgi:hypothetical protein
MLAVLVIQAALAITLPLTYDEAYTLAHFVEPGPMVAWLFFPNTNNHVLFSVLASSAAWLVPVPDAWILRGLACLCTACSFGVYAALLSRLGLHRQTVWLAIAVVLCTYGHLSQGFQGRGYALAELCFAVSLYGVIRLTVWNGSSLLTPERWRGWFSILILATAVGGCTMVSYAYCAFCIWGWWLLWELRSGLRLAILNWWLKGSLLAVLLIALFYTPVVLVNGLSALTANPNIELQRISTDVTHNLVFVGYALNWLLFGHTVWSVPVFILIGLVPGLWLWLQYPEHRTWLLLATWIVMCPWVFALGHGVWPFGRLLGWCLIGLVIPLALVLNCLPRLVAIPLALGYVCFECYFAQGRYYDDFKHDFRSKQAFEHYADCVQSAAVFDAYYWTWHSRIRTRKLPITLVPLETLPPDGAPQLIVVPHGHELPHLGSSAYRAVGSDEFCSFWVHKDVTGCLLPF